MNLPSVAIGSDHAAFALKKELTEYLSSKGYAVKDFGPYTDDRADYPDYAHPVAAAVEAGTYRFGILLCGSGEGMCMAANKHAGIRAGLVWNNETAGLIRDHNDANVLCMGSKFVDTTQAIAIVETFLNTPFGEGRHTARIAKI